ncbi:MAG: Hsp70 family protein [Thermoguttaceae bacterium]|jgi:molecular chaperone DnaK|nr:Hsp70 family protein [Thermoguttaceae bacterium]
MDPILGIDLGTTNSVVSIIKDGKPEVLCDEMGQGILPSVVGLDAEGRLLVGQEARNQALVAPERTVKSIKRKMGEEGQVQMAGNRYSPQEISAMILRTLKERAAKALGRPCTKAVITVPAFFGENQREATRQAGEMAGLEVVRIINEPTAASLVYEPHSQKNERLLVYDLGGGTFDVSIVQMEQGVVEVLASYGDTHLGGDDFDELLLDYVCDAFAKEHGVDLREIPTARSRMLQAVEEAKKRLSFEAYTTIAEEFIAEKAGKPLHVNMVIDREDYEELIEPLLKKTLNSVDAALDDARLSAGQIDRVLLVGGSTRTPLVHQLLAEQLHQQLHSEIDPDQCVALGAAVQGGLIAGVDVGPVLVDITPHTLGIRILGELHGMVSNQVFSPVIERNTALPAVRSEIYCTACDGQEVVQIDVYQGESEDVRLNQQVGSFRLEGLDEEAEQGNEILVRFQLDLDGILTVTAVERRTGLEKQLRIDNAVTRFRAKSQAEAKAKLAAMFCDSDAEAFVDHSITDRPQEVDPNRELFDETGELIAKARRLMQEAAAEDAAEMQKLAGELQEAVSRGDADGVRDIREQLDDLVFYLQDA